MVAPGTGLTAGGVVSANLDPMAAEEDAPTSEGPKAECPKAEAEPARSNVAYAFPSKSRCPRCGSLDTYVRSTQGSVQYRACRMAVCRRNYAVSGEVV